MLSKVFKIWYVEPITQNSFCGYVIAPNRFIAVERGSRLCESLWNLCRRTFSVISATEYAWRSETESDRRAEFAALKESEHKYLRDLLSDEEVS